MIELKPRYEDIKSYYEKAFVKYENNRTILLSYGVEVAYIENGEAIVKNKYSATTLRHIKEFLKQNRFKAESWKQIKRDYT